MAYDFRAESLELIDSGVLEPVWRLSRRRRFAPMSVYVAEDVAVTTFARRGVGCTWHDEHVFSRRAAGPWVWQGSGGNNGQDDLLKDRPDVLLPYLSSEAWPMGGGDPGPMAVGGGGGVHDGGTGTGAGRWISTADVRVNAEVNVIVVADRELAVPWHGRISLAWTSSPAPWVVALDGQGRPLASLMLPSSPDHQT